MARLTTLATNRFTTSVRLGYVVVAGLTSFKVIHEKRSQGIGCRAAIARWATTTISRTIAKRATGAARDVRSTVARDDSAMAGCDWMDAQAAVRTGDFHGPTGVSYSREGFAC